MISKLVLEALERGDEQLKNAALEHLFEVGGLGKPPEEAYTLVDQALITLLKHGTVEEAVTYLKYRYIADINPLGYSKGTATLLYKGEVPRMDLLPQPDAVFHTPKADYLVFKDASELSELKEFINDGMVIIRREK